MSDSQLQKQKGRHRNPFLHVCMVVGMSGTEVSTCLLDHGYAPLLVALAPLCLLPTTSGFAAIATAAHLYLTMVPLVFSALWDCFPSVWCFPGTKKGRLRMPPPLPRTSLSAAGCCYRYINMRAVCVYIPRMNRFLG